MTSHDHPDVIAAADAMFNPGTPSTYRHDCFCDVCQSVRRRIIATACDAIVADKDKEIERLKALAYNDPPNTHYSGTTWKDVAEFNDFACRGNQEIIASLQAALTASREQCEKLRELLKRASGKCRLGYDNDLIEECRAALSTPVAPTQP